MLQIANYFWQMCLLRQGPEQLPSSNFATALIFSIYLVTAFIVVTLISEDQGFVTLSGSIGIGICLQAGITYGLLRFKGYAYRFRATWSGLLGTNTFMLLILLPINFLLAQSDNESIRVFASSAWWVSFGWWLAIAGNIYHRALNISIFQGSAIAFMIELLGILAVSTLLPSA